MTWPLTLTWAHTLYLPVTSALIASVIGLWIGERRGRRAEAARGRMNDVKPAPCGNGRGRRR